MRSEHEALANGETANEFGVLASVQEYALVAGASVLIRFTKGGGDGGGDEEDGVDNVLDSEGERRMLLVRSLKAFKPNFLEMVRPPAA